MPEPLQKALQALKEGRRSEAEALATHTANAVEQKRNKQNNEYITAEQDLSRMYAALGDFSAAADALRRAIQVPARDDFERRRSQLRCRTQLGEILMHAGKEEEAQKILEDCLKRRQSFFGLDTLSAALGEAPLAELFLATGQLEAAERHAESAMLTLFRERATQAWAVVALRAAIRAARYGDERPLLEPFRSLTEDSSREALIQACLRRSLRDAPKISFLVLDELRERIEDASTQEETLRSVVSALRQAASAIGEHDRSVELLLWQLRRFEALGETQQALGVLLEIALAKAAANDLQGAQAWLSEARQKASQLGDVEHIRVLRCQARILSRQGQAQEASAALQEATTVGEALPESEENKTDLGVLFFTRALYAQHNGASEEAQPLWERALSLLPPLHPEVAIIREHQRLLARNQPCRCQLLREIERVARTRLPVGLLRAVRSQENNLQADFSSPPTQREQELLQASIEEVRKL